MYNWIRNSEKRKWCIHSIFKTIYSHHWIILNIDISSIINIGEHMICFMGYSVNNCNVHIKDPFPFSARDCFSLLLILLGLYLRSRPCCMWWWRSRAWWSPAWSRTRSPPTAGRPCGPSGLRRTSWLGGGVWVTRVLWRSVSLLSAL